MKKENIIVISAGAAVGLAAIALTLLFSTLVNLVMQRLLKRISMVESMKAPE